MEEQLLSFWEALTGEEISLNEKRLVRRLKGRDEAAFSQLVLLYQGRIFNLCYRMLGNAAEAEDLAQDVFVKCFRAIHSFREESKIGTWLYRIAVNLCKNRIKYLSRRHYQRSAQIDDVPERAWGAAPCRTVGEGIARPDEILQGNQAERNIQQALAGVDPSFRELLVLRDIEGLSYAEIRGITGLVEGTVKSRLHRARAALRRAYQALEG